MLRNWIWTIVIGSCVIMLPGCETSSSSSSSPNTVLTVIPATVYLVAGRISDVQFVTAGGDGNYTNYTWSASSNSIGTVYGAGSTALYQSTSNAGINVIRVIDLSGNVGTATVTQE